MVHRVLTDMDFNVYAPKTTSKLSLSSQIFLLRTNLSK